MLQFAQMGFPEIYEHALVGPLFQPWAEHMISRLDVSRGDTVLDVACGTGIVARLALQRLGGTGRVVAVDINPGMLAVARALTTDIEWREGDAGALPIMEGEHFDVILCQQGLQFVADPISAINAMRRAQAPDGRLGISTWRSDGEMSFLSELRRIAEHVVGPVVDRRHSMGEAAPIEALLAAAGYEEIQSETVSRSVRFANGPMFVQLNAMALVGMSAAGSTASDPERQQLVAEIVSQSQSTLDKQTGSDGLIYDIAANVVTARV